MVPTSGAAWGAAAAAAGPPAIAAPGNAPIAGPNDGAPPRPPPRCIMRGVAAAAAPGYITGGGTTAGPTKDPPGPRAKPGPCCAPLVALPAGLAPGATETGSGAPEPRCVCPGLFPMCVSELGMGFGFLGDNCKFIFLSPLFVGATTSAIRTTRARSCGIHHHGLHRYCDRHSGSVQV